VNVQLHSAYRASAGPRRDLLALSRNLEETTRPYGASRVCSSLSSAYIIEGTTEMTHFWGGIEWETLDVQVARGTILFRLPTDLEILLMVSDSYHG